MSINNENKTQSVNSDISTKWDEFLKKLSESLIDLLTLDVITATSDFDPGQTDTPIDLVDELSKIKMKNTTIYARTQLQITGDRAEIFPKDGVGNITQEEIWQFHQNNVMFAECLWLKRVHYIIDLVIKLTGIDKKRNLQPGELRFTPVPPSDDCISQVLTLLKSKTQKNNISTTENNPAT